MAQLGLFHPYKWSYTIIMVKWNMAVFERYTGGTLFITEMIMGGRVEELKNCEIRLITMFGWF